MSTSGRNTPTVTNPAGFTLIELLVVVVVMAIMASVGLSSGDTSETRLELAQLSVTDAFNRARSLAVSQRSPHAVAFDVLGDRLTILDVTGEPIVDTLTKQPFLLDLSAPGQRLGVGFASASFGASGTNAIYDAQGFPLTGGSVTLVLGGRTRVLTLNAVSGLLSGP